MTRPYEIDTKAGLQKTIRPKSAVRTAARWAAVNAVAERVCALVPHSSRVSYEQFVSDPAATLGDLRRRTGIACADVAQALGNGAPIRPGHQMAGSRIRMKPSMQLSGDMAWRTNMPAKMRARVEAVSGWMLRRYGFNR